MRHGTAVIIPAFNHFNDTKSLRETIFGAAAGSFYPVLNKPNSEKGRLKVTFQDLRPDQDDTIRTLNNETLRDTLAKNRDQKQGKSGFISGWHAFESFRTLCESEPRSIHTSIGDIHFYLRLNTDDSSPRIDLCRNGMRIVSHQKIPLFGYRFNDLQPFNALLLLDSFDGGKLHDLVRDCEGPLHNTLDIKKLPDEEGKALKNAFKEMREAIREAIPQSEGKEYTLKDYFSFESEDGTGLSPAARRIFSPSRKDDKSDLVVPDQPDDQGNGRSRRHPDPHPRSLPALREDAFSLDSRPSGPNRRCFMLYFHKDYQNAEINLRIDENVDETCETQRRDDVTAVILINPEINGQAAPESALVLRGNDVIGALIGDIRAGDTVRFDTGYKLQGGIALLEGMRPSLKVEIFPSTKQGGES